MRLPLPIIASLTLTVACATSPVNRRATVIDEADRQARQALAMEASIDPGSIPARTLSVLPFVVAERDSILTPLGYGMAELLAGDLARSPQVRLVERTRLEAIYRELALVDSGVSDPRSAPRVGRLIGARRVLIGSVQLGRNDDVSFSLRLVDVIAGTVEGLVTASAPLNRVIEAEKALAFRVFDELGVVLSPAQRAAVEQRQTENLVAVLAFGRGLQAQVKGDAAGAQAGFSEAARLDPGFAQARAEISGSRGETTSGVGIQRVLASSESAINAPVATRVPEVADVPLSTRQLITLLLSLTIF